MLQNEIVKNRSFSCVILLFEFRTRMHRWPMICGLKFHFILRKVAKMRLCPINQLFARNPWFRIFFKNFIHRHRFQNYNSHVPFCRFLIDWIPRRAFFPSNGLSKIFNFPNSKGGNLNSFSVFVTPHFRGLKFSQPWPPRMTIRLPCNHNNCISTSARIMTITNLS